MAFSFKIPEKFSFRTRLFVVMIIMLLVSGVLVLGTTSIQYESQRENYHLGRLNRKESQIKRHINYLVSKNNLFNKSDSIWNQFSADFEKINSIHSIRYSLFKLDGSPLLIYHTPLEIIANEPRLDATAIQTVGEKGWDGFSLAVVVA